MTETELFRNLSKQKGYSIFSPLGTLLADKVFVVLELEQVSQ